MAEKGTSQMSENSAVDLGAAEVQTNSLALGKDLGEVSLPASSSMKHQVLKGQRLDFLEGSSKHLNPLRRPELVPEFRCSVTGCNRVADFEVWRCAFEPGQIILFDLDNSCPGLCFDHMWENEINAHSYVPVDEMVSASKLYRHKMDENVERLRVSPIRAAETPVYYPYALKERPPGAVYVVYRPLWR
jgi:hypothetical protein